MEMEQRKQEERKKEEMLESMYEEINSMQQAAHEQNQKWIHLGLRAMLIVPWIFMFFMFWAPSGNKLVFLVLWIASMFIIAGFLIAVEYSDYLLQKKWLSMIGSSHEEIQSLSVVPPTGPMASAVMERREKRMARGDNDSREQEQNFSEETQSEELLSSERREQP